MSAPLRYGTELTLEGSMAHTADDMDEDESCAVRMPTARKRERAERAHCLQMACDLVAKRQGYAFDVIDAATRFYAFLNGAVTPTEIPVGTTAADLGVNAEPPPAPQPLVARQADPQDEEILF